ncbi:MAG: cupin [Niabella sp.]|nr:cupin [Niabella sp.]
MPFFFDKIIAPYTVADFFNTYHEKGLLHIQRNDPDYYKDVLTASELSAFLDRQDIFYPSLRIVKAGKEIPSGEYTLKAVPIGHHKKDGIVNTEKAFALFNDGATMVVQAGQRYFDNLSACCMELSRKFNAPVQANLYITPNQSQGFNPHWDTHDVFVLQVSGTKTWHLYGFEKELPTKSQGFVSDNYAKEPLQTVQLFPGDFLYIPRGYVHDAVADDGISAHITVGILSFTWVRYFAELFAQLENEKGFREAIPFWRNDIETLVKEKVVQLKNAMDGLDAKGVLKKLTDQYEKMQPQQLHNYFGSLLQVDELSDDALIRLNRDVFFERGMQDDQLFVKCFGKTISFPRPLEPLIDAVFERTEFTLQELPSDIDPESKRTVIVKLIREGVLHLPVDQ